MTRLRVVDHDEFKHQIAVGCFLSVSEEAGCGFRVYQFWVKACHIWGEQRRSFHSQVPGFRPKTRPISVPVVSRTSLSKLNLVWRRRIGINGEVPIVHAVTRGTAENGQAETDQNNRLYNDNLIQRQNKSEYRRMICVAC